MSGDHNMHCSANDPENQVTVVFRGLSADQKREIINRSDAVLVNHGNPVRDLKTEVLVLREKLDMLDAMKQKIRTLEQACELYDAALKAACPEGAKGEAFYNWSEARYLTGRPYLGVDK